MQELTGLKLWQPLGRNKDLLTGPWIAADVPFVVLDLKASKATNLDPASVHKGGLHLVEDDVDHLLGNASREVPALSKRINEL